jgi:hypothetical protein
MVDLTMTNVWLGVLAVISLIQFLMLCAAGLMAYRMYRKAMETIETIERVHVAPLRARADAMLDQVQTVVDKVRHVAGTGSAVAGAVKSKTWPIVGIIQGLKSAANVIRNGGKGHTDSHYAGM